MLYPARTAYLPHLAPGTASNISSSHQPPVALSQHTVLCPTSDVQPQVSYSKHQQHLHSTSNLKYCPSITVKTEMEGQGLTDEQAAQLQRSRGTSPLFRGLPTGTYSYRYRDAGTSTIDSLNDPPSTDLSDLISYRETTAVENGAMTLLSKQVGVESPMTGAKGRAREREMRRRGERRVIVPSQGLVDAARRASFPLIEEHDYSKSSGNLSYPELDTDGHPAGGERGGLMKYCEGRRKDAKGKEAHWQSSPSAEDYGFVLDGKWMSGAAGLTALAAAPSSETSSHGGERGREREQKRREHAGLLASTPPTPTEHLEISGQQPQRREPLLEENARLRDEIAQLRKEKAKREENARLRDEIPKLRLEKQAALEGDRSRSRSAPSDLCPVRMRDAAAAMEAGNYP